MARAKIDWTKALDKQVADAAKEVWDKPKAKKVKSAPKGLFTGKSAAWDEATKKAVARKLANETISAETPKEVRQAIQQARQWYTGSTKGGAKPKKGTAKSLLGIKPKLVSTKDDRVNPSPKPTPKPKPKPDVAAATRQKGNDRKRTTLETVGGAGRGTTRLVPTPANVAWATEDAAKGIASAGKFVAGKLGGALETNPYKGFVAKDSKGKPIPTFAQHIASQPKPKPVKVPKVKGSKLKGKRSGPGR